MRWLNTDAVPGLNWLLRLFAVDMPVRLRVARAVLLLLIVLACAARVGLIWAYNPMDAIFSDPGRHWTLGTRPLDTQPFAAIDPIGYQTYVAVLAKVTSGVPMLVFYWTALLSLSGPWLWYRFLRELLPSRDWALAGWAVFAALPSWSTIYSYFMQETLLLPLLGASLWVTWRARRKGDVGSFLMAVAVWILTGLTRGVCIPLAAVATTWLWIAQERKLAKASLALILLLGILGPLTGRSWYILHQVAPHGLGNMNALYARSGAASFAIDFSRQHGRTRWSYIFQSPSIDTQPLAPLSDWSSSRLGRAHFEVDLDAGRRDWAAAKKDLPPWTAGRYLWLTGDNLLLLLFGDSWPDSNQARVSGQLNHLSRWIWAPLAVVCLIGMYLRRSRRNDRMLPALIFTWFVVQGLLPLAVNEGRYRKPFEGLVIAQILALACSTTRRVNASDTTDDRAGREANRRLTADA